MNETLCIIGWWAAFTATHILLCSDLIKPRLVAKIGVLPFQGIYSAISFATFIPLFMVYLGDGRHAGPELYTSPDALRPVAIILVGLAMLLLGSGVASPAPSSMLPVREARVHGVLRVTRHPVSAAFFLLGLAHMLVMGFASDIAFFGGFMLFAWLATWHQDARKTAQVEGYAELRRTTSFIPFAAIILRRQPLGAALREWRWQGFVIGAIAFVALYLLHHWLFGVAL